MREHRRKLNKDSRLAKHKKARKDPGIPSMLPGKEEFVQRMREEREKEKHQRQMAAERNDMHRMVQQAAERASAHGGVQAEAEAAEPAEAAGRFYDSSKRSFYREFKSVVENADVILQVLDARDPMGCRVRAVEEMVAASGGRKRIVLVLNKIDLVPRDVVKQWLATLRREFPAVAFKASTQTQRTNLGGQRGRAADAAPLSSSECLGADTLVQLLKNYSRSLDIKTTIRVGVVGFPNVGKSSLINSLKRSKVCKVGATPGVTTAAQEIHLDRNIKLLDCPGIVFATSPDGAEMAELFLRNCVRVEQLDDPVAPVELIVARSSPDQLMLLYSVPAFASAQEFLAHVAARQGRLKKGGIPNIDAAAKSVLNDWNQGKIPFYTLPPAAAEDSAAMRGEATVVQGWAPEFDLASVVQMEVEQVLDSVAEHLPNVQPIMLEQAAPRIVVASQMIAVKKGAARAASAPYEPALTQDEIDNNPQTNQARARMLKRARKADLKKLAKTVSFADAMQVDGPQER